MAVRGGDAGQPGAARLLALLRVRLRVLGRDPERQRAALPRRPLHHSPLPEHPPLAPRGHRAGPRRAAGAGPRAHPGPGPERRPAPLARRLHLLELPLRERSRLRQQHPPRRPRALHPRRAALRERAGLLHRSPVRERAQGLSREQHQHQLDLGLRHLRHPARLHLQALESHRLLPEHQPRQQVLHLRRGHRRCARAVLLPRGRPCLLRRGAVEILSGRSRWRALGVGASCLLHVGLIAGVLSAERWIRAELLRPPVLVAELVTATSDAPPPEPPIKKPVPKPAPRMLSHLPLPRLPFTRPASSTPAAPPPPAPAAPTVNEPAVSNAPSPQSVAVAPSTSAVGPSPAAAGATEGAGPSALPSTAVASAPSGEAAPGSITRSARPQGGYQVRPSYPSTALRQGIQGTTLLKVHVLIDGRVGDVLVQQTAGHPDLDQAAIEAVRRWRFEPARRGNDPVAMWVLLPVEFQIR